MEGAGPFYLDALLTPNRSLSRGGFLLFMLLFAAANILVAGVFWAEGAYPVAGFLGLDVLLLYAAFRASYRSGRRVERVRVAFDRVEVSRLAPKRARHWVASPLWVRVEETEAAVRLRAGAERLAVGAFLSPEERESFAEALRGALARARRAAPPGERP